MEQQQQFNQYPTAIPNQEKPKRGMAIAGLVLALVPILILIPVILIPLALLSWDVNNLNNLNDREIEVFLKTWLWLIILGVVVSVITGILGFILQSIAAFRTTKRGFAITGLVLGLCGFGILSIIFLTLAGFGPERKKEYEQQAQPQIINQYFGQSQNKPA